MALACARAKPADLDRNVRDLQSGTQQPAGGQVLEDAAESPLGRRRQTRCPFHLARRTAFVTGDTLAPSATRFLKETGLPWLEKPFTPEQVLALVARIETA